MLTFSSEKSAHNGSTSFVFVITTSHDFSVYNRGWLLSTVLVRFSAVLLKPTMDPSSACLSGVSVGLTGVGVLLGNASCEGAGGGGGGGAGGTGLIGETENICIYINIININIIKI